jgi:hypothetical protein
MKKMEKGLLVGHLMRFEPLQMEVLSESRPLFLKMYPRGNFLHPIVRRVEFETFGIRDNEDFSRHDRQVQALRLQIWQSGQFTKTRRKEESW